MRCGEPEIGASDSAAEARDGAAQEREKRGFGGRRREAAFKGVYVWRRGALGLGCHRVGFLPLRGPFVGSPGPGLDPESQGKAGLSCSVLLILFFLFLDSFVKQAVIELG